MPFPTPQFFLSGPQSLRPRQLTCDLRGAPDAPGLPDRIRGAIASLPIPEGPNGDWRITFTPVPSLPIAEARAAWKAGSTSRDRYTLHTELEPEAKAITVHLHAESPRGVLYALRTALEMLATDGSVSESILVDYPSIERRGILEGYYAKQVYSGPQRDELIRVSSRLRLESYIYAPKNDPFHRDKWEILYPPAALNDVAAAAQRARDELMTFVWAIAPGKTYRPSDAKVGFQAVKDKLQQLMDDADVADFALFLDDLLRFDSKRDVALMQRFIEFVRGKLPKSRLLIVGDWYAYFPMPYNDAMGQLPQDVELLWTGPMVYAWLITPDSLSGITRSYRRPPSLWDNWPRFPGPLRGRSPDLPTAIRGFYSNPVLNELNAHPLSDFLDTLGTIADYTWNATSYEPDKSWERWRQLRSGAPAVGGRALTSLAAAKLPPAPEPFLKPMKSVRNRTASLWQSAVSQAIVDSRALIAAQQVAPDFTDSMLKAATLQARELNRDAAALPALALSSGVDTVTRCADLAKRLAFAYLEGDVAEIDRCKELLGRTGRCDVRWGRAIESFLEYFKLAQQQIPYITPDKSPGGGLVDMDDTVRIALFADWGTGLPAAQRVIEQIAAFNPQIAIHLGDIYYSGTLEETQRNFLDPCQRKLPAETQLFTLSGNHDMYSGGQGYYHALRQIGQPSSFFALRNDSWQILAMDTGLNDHDPFAGGDTPTSLDPRELDWLLEKIENSGDRRTILLSHHQLFSAFSLIHNQPVNNQLSSQLKGRLPADVPWFWGHEHNLAIYGSHEGVRGRCIGCGAIPVATDENPYNVVAPGIPFEDAKLHIRPDGALYQHGYAILDLADGSATARYYEDTSPPTLLFEEAL